MIFKKKKKIQWQNDHYVLLSILRASHISSLGCSLVHRTHQSWRNIAYIQLMIHKTKFFLYVGTVRGIDPRNSPVFIFKNTTFVSKYNFWN